MNKVFSIQIATFVIITGVFCGMVISTDVYDDVQLNIVTQQCLSCIKLDPILHLDFTFKTANGKLHPDFVLENLTSGPLFIYYSKDACPGCDIIKEVIKDIFKLDFQKTELFYKSVNFDGTIVNFFHINIEHAPEEMENSFFIYDKDYVKGLPMFTLITLGNNSGTIEPYYSTAYGTLGLSDNNGRKIILENQLLKIIDYYNEYILKYDTN